MSERRHGPGCLIIYGHTLRCSICDAPAADVSPDFSFNAIAGAITWMCTNNHRNFTGRRGGLDVSVD